jgi:hypothetical protein
MAASALASGAFGGWMVSKGPAELPDVRVVEVKGRVVAIQPRGSGRRGTFFRTVAEYAADGKVARAWTRAVYRPPQHSVGEDVRVVLLPDGEARLAFEWEAERASASADRRRERRGNRLIGGLCLGCAAFFLLLAIGVLRAKEAT